MYRNSEEEQREESWPSQPKRDFRYLNRKHLPPRVEPLRCGLQASISPESSLEMKILRPNPKSIDSFGRWG